MAGGLHEHGEQLGKQLRGRVILPGDPDYEAARRIWNGRFDRRPAAIAQCLGAADVMASIRFAREHALHVAVRGGGHSYAGHSSCDDGLVIDLSPMKAIRVDRRTGNVRAEPGNTWGDLVRELETFERVIPSGVISTVGIAGATLGGGIGRLSRKLGLAIDNLLSVDMVTADGALLEVSPSSHPDLFWAIRGAGANFGVVTSLAYKTHPLGPITAGPLVYPFEKARELLRFFREWSPTTPDDMSALINCSATTQTKQLVLAITVCYAGTAEQADPWLRPLRKVVAPLADSVKTQRLSRIQSMYDTGAPYGVRMVGGSHYLADLSDGFIEQLLEHVPRATSPLTQILVSNTLGGAVARVPEDATAFSHRSTPYWMDVLTMWTGDEPPERHERWTRDLWNGIRPFATGAAYINYMHDEGEERIRAAYGETKYQRLRELKRRYDPTNFFRSNQNIPPS